LLEKTWAERGLEILVRVNVPGTPALMRVIARSGLLMPRSHAPDGDQRRRGGISSSPATKRDDRK
jgi:hypothetical protein